MNFDLEIKKCLEVLRSGGTLLYPTDTVWGIGCDSTNEKAVDKIFNLKKRAASQAMIVLVCDGNMLNRFVKNVPSQVWDIIEIDFGNEEQQNSPITIIYDEGIGFAKNILAEDKSIGIRIVNDPFCEQLIRKFGKPIVSTSANISGDPTPNSFNEIKTSIKQSADYVVNWRTQEQLSLKPSSIIRIKENGEFKIIRK